MAPRLEPNQSDLSSAPGAFTTRDHCQANTGVTDPGMDEATTTMTTALIGLALVRRKRSGPIGPADCQSVTLLPPSCFAVLAVLVTIPQRRHAG